MSPPAVDDPLSESSGKQRVVSRQHAGGKGGTRGRAEVGGWARAGKESTSGEAGAAATARERPLCMVWMCTRRGCCQMSPPVPSRLPLGESSSKQRAALRRDGTPEAMLGGTRALSAPALLEPLSPKAAHHEEGLVALPVEAHLRALCMRQSQGSTTHTHRAVVPFCSKRRPAPQHHSTLSAWWERSPAQPSAPGMAGFFAASLAASSAAIWATSSAVRTCGAMQRTATAVCVGRASAAPLRPHPPRAPPPPPKKNKRSPSRSAERPARTSRPWRSPRVPATADAPQQGLPRLPRPKSSPPRWAG